MNNAEPTEEIKKELNEAIQSVHRFADSLAQEPAAETTADDLELEKLYDEEVPEPEDHRRDEFIEATKTYIMPTVNSELSQEVIDAAYSHLFEVSKDLWMAQFEQSERRDMLARMRIGLKIKDAEAIQNGTNAGSNEDKRRAISRELFKDLHDSIENLEHEISMAEVDDVGVCDLAVSLAKSNIERIAMRMRFLELAQLAGAMSLQERTVAQQPKGPGIAVARK